MTLERVILTTGGTGGHIFPALAVAEEICRRNRAARVLFIGSLYGPEADIVTQAGFEFIGLPARGVVGRGLRGLCAAAGLGLGVVQAFRAVTQLHPQYIIGFGGYASFAAVAAGLLARVPTAIHEQNALPGKTNRFLGKFVRRVFLSLPDAAGMFPAGKTVLTGNPVRGSIRSLYDESLYDAPSGSPTASEGATATQATQGRPWRLLVMGGSLGAQALNESVLALAEVWKENNISVWHQTGKAAYASVRAGYDAAGVENVRVDAFIDDMREAYVWADLALCRAGGSSIAELTLAGVPAVLVPFPFATHNHQLHNARSLAEAGGAVVLEQKEFYGGSAPGANTSGVNGPGEAGPEENRLIDVLAQTVLQLFADPHKLQAMGTACRRAAHPQAAALIIEAMEQTV